jgi:hypothetical protein
MVRTHAAGRIAGALVAALLLLPGTALAKSAVISVVTTPNAGAVSLKLTKVGSSAKVSFSGLNGQSITLSTASGTFASNCDAMLSLLRPDGSTLAGPVCAGQSGSLPATILPADGTYVALVQPGPTAVGTLKLTVASTGSIRSLTPNAKGLKVTVPAGSTVSFGSIVPNNVRISALGTSSKGFAGCVAYVVRVLAPNSSVLGSGSACGINDAFMDAVAGVGPGTYTVQVQNLGSTSGSTTLSVYAFQDQTQAITPTAAGALVKVKTSGTPGKNAIATFSGTSGQRISAYATNAKSFAGCISYTIELVRPDGTQLSAIGACGTQNDFLDATTLDQTGTWKVVLDPSGATSGSLSLDVYLVTDQAASITPSASGASISASVTTPGQNVVGTFSGATGQKISETATGVTGFAGCLSYQLELVRPDGSTADTIGQCGTSDAFLDAFTLDQSGTWKAVLDPVGPTTGTATFKTFLVVDQGGTITPSASGAAISATVTTPGQNVFGTFTGTTGQRISETATGVTGFVGCLSYQLLLVRPDGTTMASVGQCGTSDAFLDAFTLDQTGTWKAVLDPIGATTGSATFTTFLATNQTASITPSATGAAISASVGTPGQNVVGTFTGTTGQRISETATSVAGFAGCISYQLLLVRPDGTTVAANGVCGTSDNFLDTYTLDQSGTWQAVLDPIGATTGTATFTTYLVSDQTGTITLGGAAKNVSITTPGQNARFTFSGSSGASVTVGVTGATFVGCASYVIDLLRPDGSTLAGVGECGATATFGPTTLDASGTWTLVIDPQGATTGTASVTLS